jgi:hypothetical protein
MASPFAVLHTESGSLYRTPPMSGTPPTRGAQTLIAAGAKFSAFYPVSAQVAAANNWASPHELKQTFTDVEVREGDIIIKASDGLSYTVVSSAEWPWPGDGTVYDVTVRQPRH